MSLLLTPDEQRALRRAVDLLDLKRTRVLGSIATGAAGLLSAIALSGTAAWLIAQASITLDVVALGVAPVMVRFFGISRAVLRYCERLLSHDTALEGMSHARTRLYTAAAQARRDVIVGLTRGDVLARMSGDIDAIGDIVVRAWLPIWVAITVGVATTLAMSVIYLPAGIIVGLCLLLAGVLGPALTIRSARAAERARQQSANTLSSLILTSIDSASELSVAGRLGDLSEQIARTEHDLSESRERAARPAAWAASIDSAAMGLAVIGCLLAGLLGGLTDVWLAVIVLLPLSAFEATAALGPASVQLVRSAGAAMRVLALMDDAEASTRDIPLPVPLPASSPTGPTLAAQSLSIAWPGRAAVARDLHLEVAPGRCVAIVGPSGIGKTTLLLTLAGLLEPQAGRVSLDGVSPWEATREEVASRVSLTTEDAHIFHTTVLENLRVADGSLTPAQAQELLDAVGLGPWLAATPEGLDTVIGSDATTISGGERRRLLIARALASQAPIMLLDEPAEHLDSQSADSLMEMLLRSGRGLVVVTHRLSALQAADEVILLEASERGPAQISARGTHRHLVETHAGYRWAVSQESA